MTVAVCPGRYDLGCESPRRRPCDTTNSRYLTPETTATVKTPEGGNKRFNPPAFLNEKRCSKLLRHEGAKGCRPLHKVARGMTCADIDYNETIEWLALVERIAG